MGETKPRETGMFLGESPREPNEGELAIRLGLDLQSQTIVIDFGKPTKWIGLNKQSATELASKLNELSEVLGAIPSPSRRIN